MRTSLVNTTCSCGSSCRSSVVAGWTGSIITVAAFYYALRSGGRTRTVCSHTRFILCAGVTSHSAYSSLGKSSTDRKSALGYLPAEKYSPLRYHCSWTKTNCRAGRCSNWWTNLKRATSAVSETSSSGRYFQGWGVRCYPPTVASNCTPASYRCTW